MGAESSVLHDLDVQGGSEYAKWDGDSLATALERKQRLVSGPAWTPPPVGVVGRHESATQFVSRRQFWEVFTDYTSIAADGTFVSLPVAFFDVYAKEDLVNVLEVFAAIALFGGGPVPERMGVLYDAAVEDQPLLSISLLGRLVFAVTRAAHKVGLIRMKPSRGEVSKLARDVFRLLLGHGATIHAGAGVGAGAGASSGTDVGSSEPRGLERSVFVEWAIAQFKSRSILRRYDMVDAGELSPGKSGAIESPTAVPQASPDAIGTPDEDEAMAQRHRRRKQLRRHQRRHSRGVSQASASAFFPDKVIRAVSDHASSSEGDSRRSSLSNEVSKHVTFGTVEDDSKAASTPSALAATQSMLSLYGSQQGIAQDSRRRKGKSHSKQGSSDTDTVDFSSLANLTLQTRMQKMRLVANRRVCHELVSKVHFSLQELLQIAKTFSDVSDATGYISPEMFRAVLKRQLPALQTDDVLLSRLYAVADRDDDGRLDYREFCMSASRLLRGSMMEKLDLLFSLFDVDGNGSISIEELIHLLKHQHKELDELVQFATGLFQSMDVDASGSVTREEFAGVLAKDPVIRETFLELVLLKFGMKQQVHALQEAHPEFTFASLRDVVRRLQKTPKVLSTQVDSSHFVQFMQDQWSMPSETTPVLEAMFSHFDPAAHGGRVLIRDVVNGLAQLMAPSETEHMEVCFDLYDLDGSGSLTRDEILHMLMSAAQNTHDAARRVVQQMAALDHNGDGLITKQEFRDRAYLVPEVMHSLRIILGVKDQQRLPEVPSGVNSAESTPVASPKPRRPVKPAAKRSAALGKAVGFRLGRMGEAASAGTSTRGSHKPSGPRSRVATNDVPVSTDAVAVATGRDGDGKGDSTTTDQPLSGSLFDDTGDSDDGNESPRRRHRRRQRQRREEAQPSAPAPPTGQSGGAANWFGGDDTWAVAAVRSDGYDPDQESVDDRPTRRKLPRGAAARSFRARRRHRPTRGRGGGRGFAGLPRLDEALHGEAGISTTQSFRDPPSAKLFSPIMRRTKTHTAAGMGFPQRPSGRSNGRRRRRGSPRATTVRLEPLAGGETARESAASQAQRSHNAWDRVPQRGGSTRRLESLAKRPAPPTLTPRPAGPSARPQYNALKRSSRHQRSHRSLRPLPSAPGATVATEAAPATATSKAKYFHPPLSPMRGLVTGGVSASKETAVRAPARPTPRNG